MKKIKIENVSKNIGNQSILEKINLVIPAGKFFALLGPSGCGKTTLLRLIAGFESVTEGKIYLEDEDITELPINKRRINTVFQNYALFPHLNVFDNVAYGLKIANVDKSIIEQKVLRVLKSVHLENHVYKDIKKLSGGQQQRVALARAIVNEPEVLLLDEPLAALDFNLREKMLLELIDLQDKLKTTFIYVTHDQMEALTVADQMAIMNREGDIEQIGTPKEIYEFPVSSFVAKFVGTTNILKGTFVESQFDIPGLGLFEVFVPKNRNLDRTKNPLFLSIRPEKIFITMQETQGFSNYFKGIVDTIIYHGRSTQYNVKLKNGALVQVFQQNEEHFPQENIDYDSEVFLYWQKENVVILDR